MRKYDLMTTFAFIFLPSHEAVEGEKEGIQEENGKWNKEKDGNGDWRGEKVRYKREERERN
jgi:hypothetical protein